MSDVIMSHIFHGGYTERSLASVGSARRIILVDNSFSGEMRPYANRNPHVQYVRPPVEPSFEGREFKWHPYSCAESWNTAIQTAKTDWVINVNPDVLVWWPALDMVEKTIEQRPNKDVILFKAEIGFNLWAGQRAALMELGGFDLRFRPCGGEDEDLLCRIGASGKFKWGQMKVPALHQDGGHLNRVDGYCNTSVFKEKWGWPPHSPEYKELVTSGVGQ